MDTEIIQNTETGSELNILPIETKTRNILVLHFKLGMSAESLATIFSLTIEEVEEKITNFTEQFSNRTYLMNVINGLASMKRKIAPQQPENRDETDKDREIAELRKRLKEAEIKAEAYEEMVRLAEDRYGTAIKKKIGAK